MSFSSLLEKYMNLEPSENSKWILRERYFFRTPEEGFLETKWEDVARRVARVVATAEILNTNTENKLDLIKEWEEKFFKLLKSRVFIPNSPTLFNAGLGVDPDLLWKPIDQMTMEDYETIFKMRNHLHMLSACFVVPVGDSIEEIFEAVKEYALITKVGGGIGSNFSNLRPKGSFVAGTHGKASGPVSFMHVFNTAISVVEQGYRRRGALMGILNIDHPDIEEFIDAKRENEGESVLKYFNISVGIPMDKEEILRIYEEDGEILLSHPRSHIKRRVKLRDIFKRIAENAWRTGDPGLVFLGEMNKYYPLYPHKRIFSTNPCGEIGLTDYEACNLGSIDVAKLFDDEKKEFDFDSLREVVKIAVRFLDNVIDVNVFPLKKIDDAVKKSRRLGLGIMGFADLLYKMEIPYNSEEARKFGANLMAFISLNAHQASSDLAKEKGNFPLFDLSRYKNEENFVPFAMGMSDYDDDIKEVMKESKYHKRNVAVLTVAPTGSISNIADTSSGLEPNFLLAYTRYIHRSDGSKEALLYINRVLKEKLGEETMKKIEKVLLEKGSLKDIEGIPEDVKRIFVVALDIDPMDHLLMQDAFQRYVDNNISKTINMPRDYSVEDVLGVYLESLKTCVRGLTVYRDGSLQTQVLTKAKKLKTKEAPVVQFFVVDDKLKIRPKPRKESLRSVTRKYRRRDGTTYITVSFDDTGEAVEIFLSNGTETAEVIGRLASIALRAGVSSEEILEQLSKVRGNYVKGLADEIKKAIDDFAKLWGETVREEKEIDREKFILANNLKWYDSYYVDDEGNVYCPICLSKNSLVKQEGCTSCKVCGWSKCES